MTDTQTTLLMPTIHGEQRCLQVRRPSHWLLLGIWAKRFQLPFKPASATNYIITVFCIDTIVTTSHWSPRCTDKPIINGECSTPILSSMNASKKEAKGAGNYLKVHFPLTSSTAHHEVCFSFRIGLINCWAATLERCITKAYISESRYNIGDNHLNDY